MLFKNKVNISVLISLLSIILLLFVLGVYASDNSTVITNGTDINTTINNNEGIREVNVHNWNELKTAVDNLTAHPCEKLVINLEDGDYKMNTQQIDVKSGQNVVINGNGHTIDCNQKHFMDITTGGSVTINNLQVQNAKVKVDGGAIWNKGGNLIVQNSTFNNNHAGRTGGAIYNTGTLTVTGSTFTNNQADTEGGAIKSTGNNKPFICTDSTFIHNSAKYNGGAIDCRVLQIKNCVFTDNNAVHIVHQNGGAINCNDLNECTGCNFTNNEAKMGSGGAIAIMEKAGTNVIKDCIFKENKASSSNGDGGAIYVNKKQAHITLIHNQFINNHAVSRGNNVFNIGHYDKIEHNYFPNKKQNTFEIHVAPLDKSLHDNYPFYNLEDYYKWKG